jgi:hypothetical protein
MGELGLWYRVAPISLVGGSLQPIGGHNPFEPAALGSAILHGPYVTNFVDIYQRLTEAGAARLVTGPDTLAEAVHELMNPDKAASMAHAAWEVVSQGAEVTDRALDAIFDRLDAGQAARGACMRAPAFWYRPPGLTSALLAPLGALYAAGERRAACGRGRAKGRACRSSAWATSTRAAPARPRRPSRWPRLCGTGAWRSTSSHAGMVARWKARFW